MRMRDAATTSSDQPSHQPPTTDLDDSITAQAAHQFKEQGNHLYKSARYTEAIEKYTAASTSAHASPEERAVYLANRAAANLKLQRFSHVVTDTTNALQLKPAYSKALSRRRQAREALKEWRGALEDAKTLNAPSFEIQRLQSLADEKDKKDGQEALQSLKGLGNSILSNFGMSVDDFAVEKDSGTGSYSISMKK